MDEKILEYRAVFMRIVKKAPGPGQIERLLEKIAGKNYIQLVETLWTGNKASRKIFETETGLKLPSTEKGTMDALKEYCKDSYLAYKAECEEKAKAKDEEEAKAKAEKFSRLDGFLADNPKAFGRALKLLTEKLTRLQDGRVLCYRDAIREWNSCGVLSVGTHEEDAIKDISRSRWNNMDWSQQSEYERRKAEAGKKTIYEVHCTSNVWYAMGKIAYDYAKYLLNRKAHKEKQNENGKERCEEIYEVNELNEDEDIGYICDNCVKGIRSRGEKLNLSV